MDHWSDEPVFRPGRHTFASVGHDVREAGVKCATSKSEATAAETRAAEDLVVCTKPLRRVVHGRHAARAGPEFPWVVDMLIVTGKEGAANVVSKKENLKKKKQTF